MINYGNGYMYQDKPKGGFYDTGNFEIQYQIIFGRNDELHHVT